MTPGSPAAAAGLLVGDVLIRRRRTRFQTPRDLAAALHSVDTGANLQLDVLRGGRRVTVDAVVAGAGEQPEARAA